MPKMPKEEYIRRVNKFLEAHRTSYTPREAEFIIHNATWGYEKDYVSDIMRQIYDEVGLLEEKQNMYEGFIKLLQQNFDINRDIIEVGGGVIPSLSKRLALRQKTGTVTVYDPRVIEDISKTDNLILRREMFGRNTPLGNSTMIIAFMPCDATNMIIDVACKHNLDFMIGLCEGGMRPGYEWLEDDDEWISHVKYNAYRGMENTDMGDLKEASMAEYHNPYPVIYNKRRKS